MKLFSLFGIGTNKILAMGHCTKATVTDVQKSYLYVVKKTVRLYNSDQNTLYSHFITFRYVVNGVIHQGKLFVSLNYRCPQKGEQFNLYYDPENPQKYACYAFPPATRPIGW